MPTVVYVDTTEVRQHPLLRGGRWKEMLALSARSRVHLAVSEVVLQESERQVRERLPIECAKLERQLRTVAGLGVDVPALDALDEAANLAAESYAARVRATLEENGALVVPIPSVDHAVVVKRDLMREPPFSDAGKGYRDFLIWEGFLGLLEGYATTGHDMAIFVSQNKSDFASVDGDGLNDFLESEVSERAPGWGVKLSATLNDALEIARRHLEESHEIPSFDEVLADSIPSLGDRVKSSVTDFVDDLSGWSVSGEADEPADIQIFGAVPRTVEDVTVAGVYVHDGSIDWQIYDEYEGGTLGVSASIDVELELEGFVYKMDAAAEDSGRFVVTNWDWNDHVAEVSLTRPARLFFNMLVTEGSLDDIEFASAEVLA